MRAMRIAGAGILAVCAAGGLEAQLPIGSPKSVHGCLRPDVQKTQEAMKKAMQGGKPEEVVEVQKEVQGCTAYTISFRSSVLVVSNAPTGGTRKISGMGSITFGLAPDMGEPGYDLTSGPAELTAPVFWSDAAITMGNKCTVTIVLLPYTAVSFWLGVKGGPEPKASVQVSPAGDEQHLTQTRCPRPGGGSVTVPGRESIFTPAWIALHGQGNVVAAGQPGPMTPGMDMEKMKAMASQPPSGGLDMKKLQAMADKMKGKEPSAADMGEMMKMMKEVVPDADAQVEAARDNFMLKMPGDCAPAAGLIARCNVSRTVTLPDGLGTTQTITENTVITIAKLSAARAKP